MLADQSERLPTVEEAAKYLGRSARAVRHLIAIRNLPVVREGRSVHRDRPELGRWIELRRREVKIASKRRRTKGANL
jgi:excisionase family DNA binding protein